MEGNHPEKAVIDFESKSLADNKFQGIDSNSVSHNGLDWIEFKTSTKQFADPEEQFQHAYEGFKKAGVKYTEKDIADSRQHHKIVALVQNLINTRFISKKYAYLLPKKERLQKKKLKN